MNHLNSHINSSNISNHDQPAYRKFHPTETAFLKIHNDILALMYSVKVTALILLDLSAAFDTVDHTGKALDWFESYLTGRRQRIKLGDYLSFRADLPINLYTTPLHSKVSGHGISHHLYPDDSQLLASGDSAAALNGLQSYLASAQS